MRHERQDVLLVRFRDGQVAALVTRHLARFTAVEVVLTVLALQELAALREFDALRDRLVGLEFHRSGSSRGLVILFVQRSQRRFRRSGS